MNQQRVIDWHLLVDRFVWYDDLRAFSFISNDITDEEIKEYLYVIHGDDMSLEEIQKWRAGVMHAE